MKKNSKILSFLIVVVAIFTLVLFTKNEFSNFQQKTDQKEQLQAQVQAKQGEVNELEKIEKQAKETELDTAKYTISIKENEIIDYIYSEIERSNIKATDGGVSVIKNISISEPKLNEMGFKETSITVNLRVPNESRLEKILDYFVAETSKYKFFIDSFTYQDNVKTDLNVTIPLRIFYK